MLTIFLDLQLLWQWPQTHFELDPRWRLYIETLLMCLLELHIPHDVGTVVIHFSGISWKSLKVKEHQRRIFGEPDVETRPSKKIRW